MSLKTLTIMPDFGNGPYAWLRDENWERGIGPNIADATGGLSETYPAVPLWLDQAFAAWVICFERYCEDSRFDWATFHEEGRWLTSLLCHFVPADVRVVYKKPCEDPARRRGEFIECRAADVPELPGEKR